MKPQFFSDKAAQTTLATSCFHVVCQKKWISWFSMSKKKKGEKLPKTRQMENVGAASATVWGTWLYQRGQTKHRWLWLMVITVKESKKSQITLSATHLRTHKYKRLLFTFFSYSVCIYITTFSRSPQHTINSGFHLWLCNYQG